jgi:hypothetical protein
MKLQDYLHLYLGCDCIWRVYEINNGEWNQSTIDWRLLDRVYDRQRKPLDIKPILRPLSAMTEEEFREIFNPIQPKDVADEDFKDAMENLIENGIDAFDFDGVSAVYVFELTRKLLSKQFDLFGLIPELAIDKTKEVAA